MSSDPYKPQRHEIFCFCKANQQFDENVCGAVESRIKKVEDLKLDIKWSELTLGATLSALLGVTLLEAEIQTLTETPSEEPICCFKWRHP